MATNPVNNNNQLIPFYRAYLNEHPYSWDMLTALNRFGVDGLLGASNDLKRQAKNDNDFPSFGPTQSVMLPYPKTEFDFSQGGTYSIYNWEIFFHSVSLIARQLRQNNKFAEAIRWLNYVFDPTEVEDLDNPLGDQRYWQIKPFMIDVSEGSIQNMIRLLSVNNLTPEEIQIRDQFKDQITAWRNNPFDPHIIAAMRPRAYMLWTVMEYITTLTDWADYLFRQDTMESLNEAINLYIYASEILGPRPKKVDRPTPPSKSFHDIMEDLSEFSDVMVQFENRMTGLDLCVCMSEQYQEDDDLRPVSNCCPDVGTTSIPDLLFCVPDNPNLTALWDRVEDRLFKIRNCMNIDGKKRELALFAPPIDPAMLVQAAAAGISIEDALADAAAPLPHYRFSYMLQKANEFCNEVKGLGSQLLSLLEKKDAEELSLFRQVHEQNILKAARNLKQMAIEEAKQNKATLESSKNLIQIRLDDYKNRQYMNSGEEASQEQTRKAEAFMFAEQGARLISALLAPIPDGKVGVVGINPYLTAHIGGGAKLSAVANIAATAIGVISTVNRNKASMALTCAGYARRMEEWNLQIKTATEELLQVDRQLIGADIRIAVAEKDLANHDLQVAQSTEMYEWLKNKYTNGKLYTWMVGQVKMVYRQAFDLAYNLAKRAQVCYDYELGTSASNFIKYGQWDSTRSGLLAGERLAVQLKQLENEYIKNNEREYELSKNISLALLDPMAIEQLKATGTCDIEIPEVLFNLDHPSHYFRRIKSVSLSIPCIVGPYTNVNATLSLTNAFIRRAADLDPVTLEGIPAESIATSSSQNDSGLFEMNFRDERYIPFEGKGVVSKWTLELSGVDFKQFDFNTLSDVVIHMKYTAREGGSVYATAVKDEIVDQLNAIQQAYDTQFHYAFSLRHDMPNEWNVFKNTGEVDVTILRSRLPYLIQLLVPEIDKLRVVALTSTAPSNPKVLVNTNVLNLGTQLSDFSHYGSDTAANLGGITLGTPFNLAEHGSLPKNQITDLVIVASIVVDTP